MLLRAKSNTRAMMKIHSGAVPATQSGNKIVVDGVEYVLDSHSNVPRSILDRTGRNLLNDPLSPLCILKNSIISHLSPPHLSPSAASDISAIAGIAGKGKMGRFDVFDGLSPVVSVEQNFDRLLFPRDHVGRSRNDTYYINSRHLLRTHSSAHQHNILRNYYFSPDSHHHHHHHHYSLDKGLDEGKEAPFQFLVFADVYRRDEIDRSHFPVFHQMEGVRIFPSSPSSLNNSSDLVDLVDLNMNVQMEHVNRAHDVNFVASDLKQTMESLIWALFAPTDPQLEMRWVDAYFPFTLPSWELEIKFQGRWMEVAGCGVIQDQIIREAKSPLHPSSASDGDGDGDGSGEIGWAFGVGLERIAMALFDIPDIRLFWSVDDRVRQQFAPGKVVKYKPVSKYPAVFKDVSFWLPLDSNKKSHQPSGERQTEGGVGFTENNFFELVRESVPGDLIEDVSLIDQFVNEKTGRESRCYRLTFRSVDRTLSNQEINELQETVLERLKTELMLEIR